MIILAKRSRVFFLVITVSLAIAFANGGHMVVAHALAGKLWDSAADPRDALFYTADSSADPAIVAAQPNTTPTPNGCACALCCPVQG